MVYGWWVVCSDGRFSLRVNKDRQIWNTYLCGNVDSKYHMLLCFVAVLNICETCVHGEGLYKFYFFMLQEIICCQKRLFLTKRNISCNNELSHTSRNYLLPQNIISCPKKSFLVTRNYYCFLLEIDYLFCKWFPVALFAWEKDFLKKEVFPCEK